LITHHLFRNTVTIRITKMVKNSVLFNHLTLTLFSNESFETFHHFSYTLFSMTIYVVC